MKAVSGFLIKFTPSDMYKRSALYFLLVLFVFASCENASKTNAPKSLFTSGEAVYFDPSKTSVTLLSNDNCLMTLTIDTTGQAEYKAWAAGLFERKGDTLIIDFPDDSTKAFTALDCQYFFSDSVNNLPTLQCKTDLNTLFKKHLHFDCDSCGEMTLYYGKTKAVIEGNVIRFL